MPEEQQQLSLSRVFQQIVERINAFETAETPVGVPPAIAYGELLAEAKAINAEMLGIVERLAMGLSTVHAAATQAANGIRQLKGSPTGDRCAIALAPALTLNDQVNVAFDEEIRFAARVNQLVSQKILAEAGVNPNDPVAVEAYVKQNLG